MKPAIKTSRFFVFLSHFFDSWIERGIHILESSKKLLYWKAPSKIDFVPTPEIVTTLFLKPRDSPNTKNLTRFMIEYGLSVGSKCNSLKTKQAFKDKLGCPRAIHYLTPPPTRYVLGRCPRIKRLRSWRNCICARLLPILCAASSPLPSQNFARANDPAGYAGYSGAHYSCPRAIRIFKWLTSV